jgi:solute carrier family 25 protein 38
MPNRSELSERRSLPLYASRNVPGVAVYFYLLSEIRYGLSQTGFFSQSPTTIIPSALPPGSTISSSISEASRHIPSPSPSTSPEIANAASSGSTTANARSSSSTLPKLSSQGNIVAGAVARTSVGFVLNPITVLKSRYEVRASSSFKPTTNHAD